MADVLCVGAHPDDVEIGMRGTVATLAVRGADVLLVDLTDGEPTPYGTRERRAAEAAEAASALGCRRLMLGLPNRALFDTVEARTTLAEVIRAERPRVLFAPYPEDAHPDHAAAAAIVQAARFYAKFTKTAMSGEPHHPPRLYRYMAVHLRLVREPSFLVDVSQTLATKLLALAAYESQFRANPANIDVLDLVERTARAWGDIARVGAAEPFFAQEPVAVPSPLDLL